ncbi:vanadium-dependent haloperoxidase [Croceitalea vernalis]|uniref:Vanadium-dependent haloperoxidase n=1 Tax=Croceitalea vernalis TaxID=3075599 RepID=A0ABU3BHD3_9FLAO|nr:vanadium-dependent haloperoxidase [Croceitalea sp. P007]MDT0621554.1 vanadium-dependent haloperoxidase [Croceitalea sp. P007]
MKNTYLKQVYMIALSALLFQACATDELEALELEETETAATEADETNDEAARNNQNGTVEPFEDTAGLILGWNELWLELDQHTVGMRPNIVTRSLAYIHLAGYETAVPFMSGYSSNTERINNFNLNENAFEDNVNLDLALHTAYAIAIDHFMFSLEPGERQAISNFQNNHENELEDGLSEQEIENSERWGRHVAQRVINYSQTDQAAEEQIVNQTPDDYIAPEGIGLWTAAANEDAWFPYWREVRTFAISPNQTSSVDFDTALSYSTNPSSEYYEQMFEVYEITIGAATGASEDLWVAEFWADDVEGLMISPPGRQVSIANQLIERNELDFDQALELLLRLGFALNDAAVSAWDDKYTYNIERPSNYIREYIDEDFTTNLSRFIDGVNPAFPSYPSGHATFAGVAAGVFISFFGTDNIDFTDTTYSNFGNIPFNGAPRSFSSFTEMARENAYSRVPLGVHIEQDAIEGLRLGYEISDAVNNITLGPDL